MESASSGSAQGFERALRTTRGMSVAASALLRVSSTDSLVGSQGTANQSGLASSSTGVGENWA